MLRGSPWAGPRFRKTCSELELNRELLASAASSLRCGASLAQRCRAEHLRSFQMHAARRGGLCVHVPARAGVQRRHKARSLCLHASA